MSSSLKSGLVSDALMSRSKKANLSSEQFHLIGLVARKDNELHHSIFFFFFTWRVAFFFFLGVVVERTVRLGFPFQRFPAIFDHLD